MTGSCADAMSRFARLLAILLILAPAGLSAREPRPLLPGGSPHRGAGTPGHG